MRLLLLLALIFCTYVAPLGAQDEVGPAQPATKEGEEVQRPTPFSEQELRVIRNLGTLPTDRLSELLLVYEKLDNNAMCTLLVRQILKRNPQHPDAVRISAELDPDEEVRPIGYLEQISHSLLAGRKAADPDGIAAQANALLLENQAADAVTLLEALKRTNYTDQPFPYNEDLASAYQDAGRYEESAVLYRAQLNDTTTGPQSRLEAQKALATLAVQQRIALIKQHAQASEQAGLEESARLMKELPDNPLVIAFRTETLNSAGQHAESIRFLERLKRRSKGDTFPYQETLAFAYYGAKDFRMARSAFLEIVRGTYDEEMRTGAKQMLVTLRMDEKLERGNAALKAGHFITAKTVLAELEKEFPKEPDVFAYRCMVMAKTGKADEALELLLQKRQAAADRGVLFTEMDTLADLYAERREYVLAISAFEDIINNPSYEVAARADAAKGLEATRQQQKLSKAYLALEDGSVKNAKKIHADLEATNPKDPDVQLLGADLKLSSGQPREALADYDRLKHQSGYGLPFSGQSGMAEAYFRLGEWERALAAYDEILGRPGYEANEVWSAQWERRNLLPYLRPGLTAETSVLNESEGTRYSQSLAYTTAWWNQWRLIFNARNDTLRLADGERLTLDGDASRFEAEVTLQRRFKGGYFAEATVGGAEDNMLYGARVGKFPSSGVGWGSTAWSVGYAGNARADYGLPLQVLNGRENRIEFLAEGYLQPRVRFSGEAHGSWVHVDGEELGFGYGLSGSLEYIVQNETRKRPEVAIGYKGEYSRFKSASTVPDSVASQLKEKPEEVRRALGTDQELRKAVAANYGREIFDSLVDPETNRHGVQVTISKRLDDRISTYLQGGVYRDFSDKAWEYTLAAGVEYWLNDHSMLYAEIQYDSDGTGASEGEGAWQATLGAEVTF